MMTCIKSGMQDPDVKQVMKATVKKTTKSYDEINCADKGIKVMYWNVNGIKKKLTGLEHMVATRSIDIVLLQETHLKAKHTLTYPNYKTIGRHRAI